MPQPAPTYAGLRSQVFATRPEDVGITPSQALPHVWGALMEFQRPGAVVTLVALVDGTTSLYFSNGGGIIGAGSHPAVAEAARDFVAAAEAAHAQMQPAADFPLPAAGHVRFYALTFTGVRTAERPEEALVSRRDDLWPLFSAGNAVLTQIQLHGEHQSR